jgi:hypothetical protein
LVLRKNEELVSSDSQGDLGVISPLFTDPQPPFFTPTCSTVSYFFFTEPHPSVETLSPFQNPFSAAIHDHGFITHRH